MGKIQEIEYTFSAAKEIVNSPVIFDPTWYLIGEKESFSAAKEIVYSSVILNQCDI